MLCSVARLPCSSPPQPASLPGPSDLASSVARQFPALAETYKHFHRDPELSHHEEKTSVYLAAELRKLGYTVTEHVGKYEDGSQAYGVVAFSRTAPARAFSSAATLMRSL